MKTLSLLKTTTVVAVCLLSLAMSCKKKDEPKAEETATGTTTGGSGTTTGGTPTVSANADNKVIIRDGATYAIDSVLCGGYTATYPTYRQTGLVKGNINFGLVIELQGNQAPTAGSYPMKSVAGIGDARVTLTLPNGSGGSVAHLATSGTITAVMLNGSLKTTFTDAVFQKLGGFPVVTYTVDGSVICK